MSVKALDDDYFKGLGATHAYYVCDPDDPNTKEMKEGMEKVKDKAIPLWPKSVGRVKTLHDVLMSIKSVPPVSAGEAEAIYQSVLRDMANKGYDIKPYIREKASAVAAVEETAISRKDVLGTELVLKDGKIRPVVDKGKFKAQVTQVLAGVQRLEILKAIAKNSSEQDFWGLITDMLDVPESLELIGLLAARLLLPKENKEALDLQLTKITVLLNRQGKLSVGVVRMGGFLGLACVKGEPDLAQAVKFIKNPLLGEDVESREPTKRAGESVEKFAERKANHATQFANYKQIMTDLKRYKEPFDKMDPVIKNQIKAAVLRFCVSG